MSIHRPAPHILLEAVLAAGDRGHGHQGAEAGRIEDALHHPRGPLALRHARPQGHQGGDGRDLDMGAGPIDIVVESGVFVPEEVIDAHPVLEPVARAQVDHGVQHLAGDGTVPPPPHLGNEGAVPQVDPAEGRSGDGVPGGREQVRGLPVRVEERIHLGEASGECLGIGVTGYLQPRRRRLDAFAAQHFRRELNREHSGADRGDARPDQQMPDIEQATCPAPGERRRGAGAGAQMPQAAAEVRRQG